MNYVRDQLRQGTAMRLLIALVFVAGFQADMLTAADSKPTTLKPAKDEVSVQITYDSSKNLVVVTPDPVVISRSSRHIVHWYSDDGDIEITFKGESPFPEALCKKNKHVISGNAAKTGTFPYKVVLTINGTSHVLDPTVRADP